MLWERSVTEQRGAGGVGSGLPVTEVADRYGVSRQSVHTWIARYRAGGLEGWPTAPIGPTGARTSWPQRSRLGCASCAASIPGGGRSGFGTNWSGEGSCHCPAARRSGGCWCATG